VKPKDYEQTLYLLGRQEIARILELIHRLEEDIWDVIIEAKLDDPLLFPDELPTYTETDLF
jgi:hypothetical protein